MRVTVAVKGLLLSLSSETAVPLPPNIVSEDADYNIWVYNMLLQHCVRQHDVDMVERLLPSVCVHNERSEGF